MLKPTTKKKIRDFAVDILPGVVFAVVASVGVIVLDKKLTTHQAKTYDDYYASKQEIDTKGLESYQNWLDNNDPVIVNINK